VCVGMVLAMPLSVFTSRSSWGTRARRLGLFLTPEETSPVPELDTLRMRLAGRTAVEETPGPSLASGLVDAVVDPYVNAIHVSLLREGNLNPDHVTALEQLGLGSLDMDPRALGARLLAEGPEALKAEERIL